MAKSSVKSVFIDTSVLFAACKSKYGASAQILAYCKKGKLHGYISLYVITEVKRNIVYEVDQKVKQRLNVYLLGAKLKLIEPSTSEISRCEEVINDKDTPVLAAAIKAKVDFLTTLDKKDFFQTQVRNFIKPIQIISPKDILS